MNKPWTVCPDCGWDYDQHGDTHRWRFHCPRSTSDHVGGDHPATEQPVLGTITEARAILQQERVKAIMDGTKCTFSEACNQYIEEKRDAQAVDRSGWDAA